jgi:hypothetical protein
MFLAALTSRSATKPQQVHTWVRTDKLFCTTCRRVVTVRLTILLCQVSLKPPPNEVGYRRGPSRAFSVTPFPNPAGYFRITRLSGSFSPQWRGRSSCMDVFVASTTDHQGFASPDEHRTLIHPVLRPRWCFFPCRECIGLRFMPVQHGTSFSCVLPMGVYMRQIGIEVQAV